jgi:hypothetical protein
MFLGLITSSLFYAGTKEPRAQRRISRLQSISSQQSSISSSTRDIIKMTWKDWLAQRQFYQVLTNHIDFNFMHIVLNKNFILGRHLVPMLQGFYQHISSLLWLLYYTNSGS